jgi:S-adenosylmethionine hydrolase
MLSPSRPTLPIITLLTDFGTTDAYGAMMKGAIAGLAPQARVIDLTHEIPPQNITAARFQLMMAYPYFPPGTIHVAVVDPGVGSQRRAIAVALEQGWVVAPDNGLISGLVEHHPIQQAVVLTNPAYWRSPQPSPTFQGRDIFAPVAAHLARGVPLTDLGDAIAPDSLVASPVPPWRDQGAWLEGTIQAIDHFGTGITTIPAHAIAHPPWHGRLGDRDLPSGRTYSDVPWGQALLLAGSHGFVEVAVNGGHAQTQLGFSWGSAVRLYRRPWPGPHGADPGGAGPDPPSPAPEC